MEKFFFMRRVLDLLGKPGFLNRVAAITLRAIAGLIILLSLVVIFNGGKVIFKLPASGILGGILFQACFILAIYAVVHTLVIRAREIDMIRGAEFSTFPLVALLVKTFGEMFSAFTTLVAVGGGVYVWFTGKNVATILTPMHRIIPTFGDTTFMGGIQFMVGGVLFAMATLLVCYMVSETIGVLSEGKKRLAEKERITEVQDQPLRLRSGT